MPSSASAAAGRRHLRRAAVDHQQVRRVGEPPRPPGLRVDPGRAAAVRRPGRRPAAAAGRRPPRRCRSARPGSGPSGGGPPRGSTARRRLRDRRRATSAIDATSSPADAADGEPAVVDLRGSPSSKTTSEATTSVPWTCETSMHSIRSGAVSRPERVLELGQRRATGRSGRWPASAGAGRRPLRRCGRRSPAARACRRAAAPAATPGRRAAPPAARSSTADVRSAAPAPGSPAAPLSPGRRRRRRSAGRTARPGRRW